MSQILNNGAGGGGGGGTNIQTVTGNSGGPVGPDGAQNINIIGSGVVDVTGNPGTNTLTISVSDTVATEYDTDSGSAVPALGVLNVLGGNNIVTSGAGNTVTIDLNGTTNHAVQIGNASASLTSLAVGTDGQVLIGATAADPAFATLTSSDGSVSFTPGANSLSLQVATGSGVVKTLTGNVGGPVSPTLGNINVVTANSTPRFSGLGSTEQLDFGLTNIVLGSSLPSLAGGVHNVGMGLTALNALTSASNNTAIGYLSGLSTTTGSGSTFVGANSGLSVTTGTSNTALGAFSLSSATTGAANAGANVAVGNSSLQGVSTGISNTAIGTLSGSSLLTGSSNILVGSSAASAYTGAESSNIIVGNTGVIGESNKLRIGTSGSGTGQQNATYIAGIDGVNVGSVAKVVTMASDQLGTATITAGTNIAVTPTANTITIASTGPASFTWAVTTVNATIVVNNGYIANKAGLLTMTLPATAAIGDLIEITGINTAVGWRIAQNANQQIFFGTSSTTLGATGYLEATQIRDSARLVCVVAGASTVWNVLDSVGNLTVN